MTMDLRQAVDTLHKFKNVLGSVEALEKALSVAAALDQYVAAKTAQRDTLVEEIGGLEAAIVAGKETLAGLEIARKDKEREIAEYSETASKRVADSLEKQRVAAKTPLENEIADLAAKRAVLNSTVLNLRSEKRALEESVSILNAKLQDLKAAAASA